MESFLNAILESPSFPRAFSGNPGEVRMGLVLVAGARPKTGRGDEHESRTRLKTWCPTRAQFFRRTYLYSIRELGPKGSWGCNGF